MAITKTFVRNGQILSSFRGDNLTWTSGRQTMNTYTAEQAFTRFGWAIDRRDWRAVRDVLAATVAVDFTELFGGEPASMSREELTGHWRAQLERIDATQHVIANVQAAVSDNGTVHATANVVATHVRGGHRGRPDMDGRRLV